jgi:anti-anti-sigma factor
MDVETRSENGATILAVGGRLDAVTAPELEGKINELMNSGPTAIVMSLSKLEYISSAGLRVILAAAKKLKAKQAKFLIAGLQDAVKQVFEISGFYSILSIHASEEEALSQL